MIPKNPVVAVFCCLAVCATVVFCTLYISADVAKMVTKGKHIEVQREGGCKCEYCDGDKCYFCPCKKDK